MGNQALTKILETGANCKSTLGKCTLGTSIYNLEEEFAHCCVDSVTDEVSVKCLEDGLSRKNLASHGCRMGHSRASNRFNETFFNDTFLYIKGKFARTLLRSTPSNTMGKTGDVLDFFCLNPLPFFRNGSRTMVGAFGHATHVLNFVCVLHIDFLCCKKLLFRLRCLSCAKLLHRSETTK